MIGLLILILALVTFGLFVGVSIKHILQSASLNLGNYTMAYSCKGCNAMYSTSQKICSICGYEHSGMMSKEIGKWHCTISKLRIVYYWEPKNV